MRPAGRRYELSWRRQHLAVLLVACSAACALLAREAVGRVWFADSPTVIAARSAAARELIDPNTASAASLQRLSLIGPVTAQAIVEYRSTADFPAFGRPEDLTAVRGVGPGLVERARDHLTFGPAR